LEKERAQFSTVPGPETWPLPPTLASRLRAARRAWRAPGEQPDSSTPEEEAGTRRLDQKAQADWASATGIRIFVSLHRHGGSGWFAPGFDLNATPAAVLPDRPRASRFPGVHFHTPTVSRIAPPLDPPVVAEDDPVLGARRRLKLDDTIRERWKGHYGWLTRLLPAIAASYDLNLVADAYRMEKARPPDLLADVETPLYEVLNRLVGPAARWTRDGAFLRVRRHRWHEARREEIPDRLAKQWSDLLRQRRQLSLEETVALVTAFRDEQLQHLETLLGEEGVLLPEVMDEISDERLPGSRDLLRAYACLPPWQRQRLQEEAGLGFTEMPLEARRHLLQGLDKQERHEDVPASPAQLAAGTLHLELQQLERVVTVGPERTDIEYRIVGPRPRPGEAAPPGRSTRRMFIEHQPGYTPPLGSQSLQQAVFRYQFARSRAHEYSIALPWVHVQPKPPGADRR
jgi:hypothetical protein